MIPYTKMRLFACWNNLHTIVSARGDYSPFQIVYALRRQSPLSNCVRERTQFRLFLIESLCQKSLRGRAAVYFIKTIEKTDMRLGISVKKRNISIYGITSTCAIHQPKATHDNALVTHLRCGM